MNTDDFLQGQRDCKDGVSHKPNQSEAYDRGYSTEYIFQQVMDARTENVNH